MKRACATRGGLASRAVLDFLERASPGEAAEEILLRVDGSTALHAFLAAARAPTSLTNLVVARLLEAAPSAAAQPDAFGNLPLATAVCGPLPRARGGGELAAALVAANPGALEHVSGGGVSALDCAENSVPASASKKGALLATLRECRRCARELDAAGLAKELSLRDRGAAALVRALADPKLCPRPDGVIAVFCVSPEPLSIMSGEPVKPWLRYIRDKRLAGFADVVLLPMAPNNISEVRASERARKIPGRGFDDDI
jgi:hypothetical protein